MLPKIYFVDINQEVVEAFEREFSSSQVEILCGNVMDHAMIAKFDAVVSPANSLGYMRGGIDGVYSQMFPQVEENVMNSIQKHGHIATKKDGNTKYKYLPLGAALITKTGSNEIPYVVCAPTMRFPGTNISKSHNAYHAMYAALRVMAAFNQKKHRLNYVFCPSFGTGVGGLEPTEAASQMHSAMIDFMKD